MFLRIVFFLSLLNLSFSDDIDDVISNVEYLFKNKQYRKIAELYPPEEFFTNSSTYLNKNFDFNYIYAIVFFDAGDFSSSLRMLKKSSTESDLNDLAFFCYLNLKDFEKAKGELKNIKNKKEELFYSAIFNFSQEDNSKAIKDLESYLDKNQTYYIEALLLDYTFSFRKESFKFLLEWINKRLYIDRKVRIEKINYEAKKSSPFKDFLEFKKIMEKDKETAKKELLVLIKETSSEVIRNLASYEYRNL